MLSDGKLVELILGGDRERYGILVERYQRQIYSFLRKMGLEHDDAGDVLQVAFVKAYRKLGSLREKENFRVWLYSIAANQARNHVRSRHREVQLEDPVQEPAVEDTALDAERKSLKRLMEDAIERLPEEQRRVVVLRTYQEMPFKEIADTCGISLSNAKVTYHRALKKMYRWLKPRAASLELE